MGLCYIKKKVDQVVTANLFNFANCCHFTHTADTELLRVALYLLYVLSPIMFKLTT